MNSDVREGLLWLVALIIVIGGLFLLLAVILLFCVAIFGAIGAGTYLAFKFLIGIIL